LCGWRAESCGDGAENPRVRKQCQARSEITPYGDRTSVSEHEPERLEEIGRCNPRAAARKGAGL
jgi:hypothetical protein